MAAAGPYRDDDGSLLGQKVTPLDRVGIYVPDWQGHLPQQRVDERPARPRGWRRRGSSWSCRPRWHPQSRWCCAAHVAGAPCLHHPGGAEDRGGWPTAPPCRVDKITGPAMPMWPRRSVMFRTGRHRHDCRPERIWCAADGSTPPTGGLSGPLSQAGTMNWRRASCSARTPPPRHRTATNRRAPAAEMPHRSHHPGLARRARRPVVLTGVTGSLRIGCSHCPEHLEVAVAEPRRWDRCSNAGPSSWRLHQ